MNHRLATAGILALFLTAAAPAQDKAELRYAFKKGEKFPFTLSYGLGVKLEKVPELLQGVLSEDPIELKFEGTMDVEVVDVKEDGTATLKGAWRTAKAKGHVMVNDVDFQYDAAKAGELKPKEKKEGDDPALQGFMDVQDQMAKMVREPVQLDVDPRGKVTVQGGAGRLGELEGPFRSLNGLMGPLPTQKLGKGDGWKEEVKLGMPGVGGNVDLKVATDNVVESLEGDTLVIASKYTVLQKGTDAEGAPGLNVKMKTEGGGTGKMHFLVKAGRPLKSQSSLRVKVSAVIPNPGGGDDMDLKANVKMDMGHELGR